MTVASPRAALKAATVLVVAACLACESVTAPDFPSSAVAMDARPQYDFWWRMTEACSGLSGTMSDISWYEVPGVDAFPHLGEGISGAWWSAGNRIVVAGNMVDVGPVVRHEMLHALVRGKGHPAKYFQDRCRGFVDCLDACMAESPPPAVPSGAALVQPQALTITSEVSPASYTNGDNGGWIAVTVSVTNPAAYPVWVVFPDFNGAAETFGARFTSGIGTTDISWSDRLGFQAAETKREVFDIHFGSGGGANPGEYAIHTFFNTDSAPPLTFVVVK